MLMRNLLIYNDVLLGYDKNNKEILFNSKIKFNDGIGEIIYSNADLRFEVVWEDGFSRSLTSDFLKECEVIYQ